MPPKSPPLPTPPTPVPSAKRKRRHHAHDKKGLTVEEVIQVTAQKQDTSTTPQVVHPYKLPYSKRAVFGKRGTFYGLIALVVTAVLLAVSYYEPWAFGLTPKPIDKELSLNFSLLRKFPFTNFYLPDDKMTIAEKEVVISGRLKENLTLTINSLAVEPNEDGFFSTIIELQEGENIIDFAATLGSRTRTMRRTYYYVPLSNDYLLPPESAPLTEPVDINTLEEQLLLQEIENRLQDSQNQDSQAQHKLILTIDIFPDAVWVETKVDRITQPRLILQAGMSYTWEAEESISLTVENGSAVLVTLNGTTLGPLSDKSGPSTRAFTWGDVVE